MKQRTIALLLTAALGISLLGITALAVEGGDMPAPDTSASQPETIHTPDEMTVSPEEPPLQSEEQSGTEEEKGSFDTSFEEYIPDPVGSISFSNVERRMREGNLQIKALQESIEIIDEIDYDKLKDVKDPNWKMLLPLFVFTLCIIGFGLYSQPIVNFFNDVAGGGV